MGNRMDEKIALWLDCDPGHDDAFALLFAAYHPSLYLLGVSTVYGNASLDRTTNNALSILEAIGRPDIAVIPGAKKPFCREAHHAPEIHGESGLDGTDLLPQPTRSASKCNAVVDMYEALMACPPNTAWLVTTGALTNAALLFTTFPKLVDHIRGLSIMGGAIGSHFTDANLGNVVQDASGQLRERIGNHTPYAEFNIWCDPESAQSIFSNSQLIKKTTLIPLDVTHQLFATQSVQDMVLCPGGGEDLMDGQGSTRLRRMFFELLTFFAKTYADVFGLTDGPPLHDPIAVAVLLAEIDDQESSIDMDDHMGERFRVDVDLTEPERGRTSASPVSEGVRIPRSLDTRKFWRVLNECLERADEAVGESPSRT